LLCRGFAGFSLFWSLDILLAGSGFSPQKSNFDVIEIPLEGFGCFNRRLFSLVDKNRCDNVYLRVVQNESPSSVFLA